MHTFDSSFNFGRITLYNIYLRRELITPDSSSSLHRDGMKSRCCSGPRPAVSGTVCFADLSFVSICQIAAQSGMQLIPGLEMMDSVFQRRLKQRGSVLLFNEAEALSPPAFLLSSKGITK